MYISIIATDIGCDRPDAAHPDAPAASTAARAADFDSYPWTSRDLRWMGPSVANASNSCPVRPNPRHGPRNGADDEHVRHRQPS